MKKDLRKSFFYMVKVDEVKAVQLAVSLPCENDIILT